MDQSKRRGKTKVNKPLAERRRRARINDALLQLKSIVLQSISKETTVMSKLEKADILELTVEYIHNMQTLQSSYAVLVTPQYTTGFNECVTHVTNYISNVADNSVQASNESCDSINSRLLEHLVNVTASGDLLPDHQEHKAIDAAESTKSSDVFLDCRQEHLQVDISKASSVDCLPEYRLENDENDTVKATRSTGLFLGGQQVCVGDNVLASKDILRNTEHYNVLDAFMDVETTAAEVATTTTDFIQHETIGETFMNGTANTYNVPERQTELVGDDAMNVTTGANFLSEDRFENLGNSCEIGKKDVVDHSGNNSGQPSTKLAETETHSEITNTENSDKAKIRGVEHVIDTSNTDISSGSLKSKTASIPKKRKVFGDFTNFASIKRHENEAQSKTGNTLTPHPIHAKSKVKSPPTGVKQSPLKIPRSFPKPIKKRLAALIYKDCVKTSSPNTKTNNITEAVECNHDKCKSNTPERTEERVLSSSGKHTTHRPTSDMVNENQNERTTYTNIYTNSRSQLAATSCSSSHPPIKCDRMPFQTESATKESVIGQYACNTTIQPLFMNEKVPNTNEMGTENAFTVPRRNELGTKNVNNFYLDHFDSTNTETVWRPW